MGRVEPHIFNMVYSKSASRTTAKMEELSGGCPCLEWGVSLYFEKCLPAFCVVGGIDCVRDSKVGTP